jgi:N-acetylglucosamine-6-sulfatase
VRSSHTPSRLRAIALKAAALATLGAVAGSGIASGQSFPVMPGDPPAPPGPDPHSPRPNVVVIVLDDIPPLDGRLWKKLPNIERYFVRQGQRFTNAHSESPVCTPGRASLLTGLHEHHHGAVHTDATATFRPEMTVATALQAEGYHTIMVGKYLNLFDRIADKTPPGWDEIHAFRGAYYDYTMYSNGVGHWHGTAPKDYSTDVIARTVRKTLHDAPRNEPLFMWIAPYSVHKPWTVAPRHAGSKRCNGIARWKPPNYMEKSVADKPAYVGQRRIVERKGYDLARTCRGMLSVDEMIGHLVSGLKKSGRLDNTMLVLTSDNGMAFGSQRFLNDKKAPYGTQIPLMIRWPRVLGLVPKAVDERVQNIDLAPTICDIAGCTLGPYPTGQARPDGVSLLKLMTMERKTLLRKYVIGSYLDQDHRVPTYWSITTTGSSPLASKVCRSKKSGGCRWMYTAYATGEVELYDLSGGTCYEWKLRKGGDPCMLKNKAGKRKYALIQRTLRETLARKVPGL